MNVSHAGGFNESNSVQTVHKRTISRSSTVSPLLKRVKRVSRDQAPFITECTEEQVDGITKAIVEDIIEKRLPFNFLDREHGYDNDFVRVLKLLRPGYADNYLPNRNSLSNKYLNSFHSAVLDDVKQIIRSSLQSGFGTVIFDGWEDITSAPFINVLLRTEGDVEAEPKIFFLKSVYTCSKKAGAVESLVEK